MLLQALFTGVQDRSPYTLALNLGTAQMPDIQIFLYRSCRIEIRANAAVYAALAYQKSTLNSEGYFLGQI
jgi:hypothetical protein